MSDWRSDAACASADPLLFDPDSSEARASSVTLGRRLVFAFDYCKTCPVVNVCLTEAVENEDSGVRGGLWLDEGKPVPFPSWSNPGPGRTPYPCGTEQARERHIRWGEDPCDECRDNHEALKAYNLAERRRVAAHRRMTGAA